MADNKRLRKTLRLTADNDCTTCEGTGIKATNTYFPGSRKLEVVFEICGCVRVKPLGLYLPPVTPDATITVAND